MPTLVLEDGTALATSNAYADADTLDTYCDDHGITLASSDGDAKDSALIRASAALDGAYRLAFPGYRTSGRDQAMEWPRTAAYDYEGVMLATDEVPQEVIDATCEMAVREVETPGIMTPDLERGGFVRRLKAGSVEVEYGGSNNQTVFTIIDGIMSKLVGSQAVASTMFGIAVRG